MTTKTTTQIVHMCPPDGSGLTPCCGKTPFELPHTDHITLDQCHVTCNKPALETYIPEVDRNVYENYKDLRAAWLKAPEGTIHLTLCEKCLSVVPDMICAFQATSGKFWEQLFGEAGKPTPKIVCIDCMGHTFCHPFFELKLFADEFDAEQIKILESQKINHDCSMKNVFQARREFAYLIERPKT